MYLVPSRDGKLIHEVYQIARTDFITFCREAIEMNRDENIRKNVQFLENEKIDTLKEYVLELGEDRSHLSFILLSAFKCPTYPRMYIHVDEYDRLNKSLPLWVIFKRSDPLPDLNGITGYQMLFVRNVAEGRYVNEIIS